MSDAPLWLYLASRSYVVARGVTPVPEPGSKVLIVLGLLALGATGQALRPAQAAGS